MFEHVRVTLLFAPEIDFSFVFFTYVLENAKNISIYICIYFKYYLVSLIKELFIGMGKICPYPYVLDRVLYIITRISNTYRVATEIPPRENPPRRGAAPRHFGGKSARIGKIPLSKGICQALPLARGSARHLPSSRKYVDRREKLQTPNS